MRKRQGLSQPHFPSSPFPDTHTQPKRLTLAESETWDKPAALQDPGDIHLRALCHHIVPCEHRRPPQAIVLTKQ